MLNTLPSVQRQRASWTSKPASFSTLFALGRLGHDFVSEARRDFFLQRLGGTATQPFAPLALAEYLREHPEDAQGLTWTLTLNGTPLYALAPAEQFSAAIIQQLIRLLMEQEKHGSERISLAGCISGAARLLSGGLVPQVIPVMRGTGCWNVARFASRCLGRAPLDEVSPERERYQQRQAALLRFVEQLAVHTWNLGGSAKDRALNFAITHAFHTGEVFEEAFQTQQVLDTVTVEGSTRSSPGAECWDVKLRFRDPAGRHARSRKIYRYIVDVNDSIPSVLGGLQSWFEF